MYIHIGTCIYTAIYTIMYSCIYMYMSKACSPKIANSRTQSCKPLYNIHVVRVFIEYMYIHTSLDGKLVMMILMGSRTAMALGVVGVVTLAGTGW